MFCDASSLAYVCMDYLKVHPCGIPKKWDPGTRRQQVGHQDLGLGTPKCLGGTRDPRPQNIQVGPANWDPKSET